jgi:hypothetical protein
MANATNDAARQAAAARQIDDRIAELGDWRGHTLTRLRALIWQADPQVVEEWKWGVPVWSHGGILCTGETYNDKVKLTFAKGASLPDPARLFNSSLDGGTRRAIDFRAGDEVRGDAFKALIAAAVAHNTAAGTTAKSAAAPSTGGAGKAPAAGKPAKPAARKAKPAAKKAKVAAKKAKPAAKKKPATKKPKATARKAKPAPKKAAAKKTARPTKRAKKKSAR